MMSTIIRSDIYRLRHGTMVRNVLIVLLAVLAFLAVMFVALRSEQMAFFVESGAIDQYDEGESETLQQDFSDVQDYLPANAAEFTTVVTGENMLLFFFIPIILAIFCADFTDGTYRNTLSYESDRTKIYLAKLALSVGCCFLLNIVTILACWVVGGIAFGALGFSAAYLLQTLVSLLLFLPGQLATICFLHCLIVFTRKSSSTIGIYIALCLGITTIVQLLTLIPQLGWVSYFDWNSVGQQLINYSTTPLYGLVLVVCSGLLAAVITTLVGINHYRKADLTL